MRLLRYAPSDSSTYLKYASGVLGRKPCIHIRLGLLATNPWEKCGLRLAGFLRVKGIMSPVFYVYLFFAGIFFFAGGFTSVLYSL